MYDNPSDTVGMALERAIMGLSPVSDPQHPADDYLRSEVANACEAIKELIPRAVVDDQLMFTDMERFVWKVTVENEGVRIATFYMEGWSTWENTVYRWADTDENAYQVGRGIAQRYLSGKSGK